MKTNTTIWTALTVSLVLSWSCDDGGGSGADADTDMSGEDAGEDVSGEPEAETPDMEDADADLDVEEDEAAPGPEGYCRACTYDSDCGPGGACIEMDAGELGCGIPCELPTDCPTGSGCENVPESEDRQCVPTSGTCVWDPLGISCPSWGCSGRYDLCSDPAGEDGYCTHACRLPVDCDVGYTRCLDRGDGVSVCMKNLPEPAARCGVTEHPSGVGSPCGSATCADGVFVCARDLEASLPAICVRTCDDDPDCPEEEMAACVSLAGLPEGQKYCVPDECRCLGVVPGSLFDALLAEGGLTRCDLSWDVETLTDYFGPGLAQDRFRIPWTDDVHNDWLRALPATDEIEENLDAAASLGPAQVIVEAAALSGHSIEGGETAFEPAASSPLVAAMAELLTELGEAPDMTGLEADAADVPGDVQIFAARLILAATQAVAARSQALAVLEGDSWEINHYYLRTPFLFLPTTLGGSLDVTSRKVQDFLIGRFDYAVLYQAAYDLAHTVELHAADVADHPASESFSFSQSTPAGRVEIRDGGNTQYAGAMTSADYVLVLDVGGDDEYQIGAGSNTSGDNPVSLLVDLGGEDTYAYFEVPDPNDGSRLVSDADGRISPTDDYGPWTLSKTPRQGSGRLGIGMLFDFGSMDDAYRSLRMSQGSGILGVGLLFDDGGSDRYDCEAGCQGSGAFGLGILIDAGGPGAGPGDVYSAYHAAQGFAYAKAVGILLDHEGDESYLCNQGDVLYPSPQSDISNSSLCQGMGFGRRADVELGGDGVFMSGGIGILRDLAGADDYTSAVFGQGSGYWFGFGFLLDAAGDDAYNGRYYVQGSTAHYATSVLHDGGGQDTYNREEVFRLYGTIGAGHDFSSSFHIDDGGVDLYFSPGRSLGTANDNAFGILVDREGDDAFQCTTDYSLGNANLTPEIALTRGGFPTLGMFMDCGGTDTYDRPDTTLPGNDVTWQQEMHTDSSSEIGLGGDTSTMPCGL